MLANRIGYLFGWRGIASRLRFWVTTLCVAALCAAYVRVVVIEMAWVWGVWKYAHLACWVVATLMMLSVSVRRLKDLSQPALWGLLVFFPPAMLLLLVPLGFFRGAGDYREIRSNIFT